MLLSLDKALQSLWRDRSYPNPRVSLYRVVNCRWALDQGGAFVPGRCVLNFSKPATSDPQFCC